MAKTKTAAPSPTAKRMDAVQWSRIALGVLAVANLVGAYMLYNPPGGSAESLDQQLATLQQTVKQAKAKLEDSKHRVGGLDQGRGNADEFLKQYFITRRAVAQTMVTELTAMAKSAGIKERGNAFSFDLIDGTDSMGMETIAANYEGNYRSLLSFIRLIDRSNSLIILESLSATPIQDKKDNVLNVTLKFDAFVKDDPALLALEQASAESNAGGATR